MLIDKGANVNIINEDENAALILAALKGNTHKMLKNKCLKLTK